MPHGVLLTRPRSLLHPLEVQPDGPVHEVGPGHDHDVHDVVGVEDDVEAAGVEALGEAEGAESNADGDEDVLERGRRSWT